MPDRPLRSCSRGHRDKPDGCCPTCRRIAEEETRTVDAEKVVIIPADDDHGATFHPEDEG